MAKKAKRKASAPPMGYNARKKMNKHRPLTQKEKRLILIGIGVLVLAAILFAIFYDDGSLPMRGEDVVTEGAQQMLSYAVDPETGERAAEPSAERRGMRANKNVGRRRTRWPTSDYQRI